MKTETAAHSNLGETLARLKLGDHACLIYDDPADQFEVVIPFVRLGLERGERCVYVADDNSAADVFAALRGAGIDVEAAVARGALVVLTKRDTYLKRGHFEPDAMIRHVRASVRAARAGGCTGLRGLAEATWCLADAPGAERVMEYEAKLNHAFGERDCVALCQYNRRRFRAEVIRDAVRTHPVLIHNGIVARNPFYVPPGELLGPDSVAHEVDRWLENIAERQRTEESFHDSERRYRSLVETSPDAITLTDLAACILLTNQQAARLHGFRSPEEMVGRSAFDLIAPEDRDRAKENARRTLAMGTTKEIEYTLLRKDGTPFPGEISASLIVDEAGQPKAFIGVVRDLRERKRAEQQRLALEQQFHHAQKLESLGILAGEITHDFNNILTVVLGNLDLVAADLQAGSPAAASLVEARKAATRAADLCQQLLAYSGRGRFALSWLDLNALVREMTHLLEISASRKATIQYHYAAGLPLIEGDATQVSQVVMNLITNASEALGDRPGLIAVRTGVMDCDRTCLDQANSAYQAELDQPLPEGRYVYCEVSDTGGGMDPKTQANIFNPFFTTKSGGRGLGLAAVLGIVRRHRGAIKVHAEPGKGAAFKVLFPAGQPPVSRPAAPGPESGEQEQWRGSGVILVADDERPICTLAQKTLQRLGFKVLIANDGREAVEVFRQHASEIACVLLDLTMPCLDGEQALRELLRIRADTKVILCSGYNEQEALRRFAGKGLAGFLQKPYRLNALQQKLRTLLGS